MNARGYGTYESAYDDEAERAEVFHAPERVRLASPYGYATGKNADGSRHLSNGATGVVVGGRWNDNLRVSFDFPDDGTYELPSHWFTPLPRTRRTPA